MTMVSPLFLLCVVLSLALQFPSTTASVSKESEELATKSAAVVSIGAVSGTLALVRPDKLTGNTRTLPDGQEIAELPQPREYYVGHNLSVSPCGDTQGNKMVRVGQTITVLVPGLANTSDRVALLPEHKYLLQLSPLKDDAREYEGMVVMDLAHLPAAKQPFALQNTYTIIRDLHGALPVTMENQNLIKVIRRAARKR